VALARFCKRCKIQSPPGERACTSCGGQISPEGPPRSDSGRHKAEQTTTRRPPARSGAGRRPPGSPKPPPRPAPPKISLHVLLGEEQEQQGPFEYHDFKRLVREGRFTPASMVWKKGMPDWVAAATLEVLKPLFEPPPASKPAPVKPAADVDTSEDETQRLRLEQTKRLDPAAANKLRAMAAAIPSAQEAKAPTRKLRPEDVKAFLCCEPFRAVPLTEGKPISVGRSRTSDLVLPHESVSRTHALVRVLGDTITVEDKSTYGLHLNGERIQQGPIKIGDLIQLGPYMIAVRAVPDRTAQQMGEEVTRPLRTLGATSEAMHGRLERVSLAEVLQTIEFNQKTGTLRVFDDSGVASTLVVYEGAPVYAESEDLKDSAVVHHMLRLKRGQFSFSSKVEAGEMSMQGQTVTGILLDFSRLADEA
tara:strand:+ start:253 stop:1512 length:1260 start_codon:yes stop_codon:yes gene_type:complete